MTEEPKKKKRKMSVSATQRTLKELRKNGWTCGIVEKWNQFAHIRQDLFGFIDIVAMKPGHQILAVQCTTGAHHPEHKAKILAEPRALIWLKAGGRIDLVSWAKHKKVGIDGKKTKQDVYTMRVEPITEGDFET